MNSNIFTPCKEYKFKDIEIGMQEQFSAGLTQEKQDEFTHLSGDVNPMHVDSDFASGGGYKGCIVYGMCTASFYSTLVGVYLPGKYCLFHECNIQWVKPVYIGDVLTITGVVSDIDTRFKRVTIKANIKNQNGEKVSRAKLIVGFTEENR